MLYADANDFPIISALYAYFKYRSLKKLCDYRKIYEIVLQNTISNSF